SPRLHHALFIGRFHMHEGVWVAEEKLHHIPFDFLRLPLQIGGSERMMGVDTPASGHDPDHQKNSKQGVFHALDPQGEYTSGRLLCLASMASLDALTRLMAHDMVTQFQTLL